MQSKALPLLTHFGHLSMLFAFLKWAVTGICILQGHSSIVWKGMMETENMLYCCIPIPAPPRSTSYPEVIWGIGESNATLPLERRPMWKLSQTSRSLDGQPAGRAMLRKSRICLLLGLVVITYNCLGKGRLMGEVLSWDQTESASEWNRCLNVIEVHIWI